MDNLIAKLTDIFDFVTEIVNYIYDFFKSLLKKETV